MTANPMTETVPGRLLLTAEPRGSAMVMVHQDTPLGLLDLSDHRNPHVFALDDSGAIVGVISTDGIAGRLNAADPCERNRWAKMPLSHLVKLILPRDTTRPRTPIPQDVHCTAVFENGSLISIVGQQDVFISWRRLAAAVSDCTTDALTGLMSRLAYQRRLYEEWDRAQRGSFSIGIIVVDLDHFKATNDSFGHDVGDRVLCDVASALEASLRSYDVLVRYGGDEFVALCVGCRPGEIRIPIARILKNLRERKRKLPEGVRVSASIGAAVRHAGFRDADPATLFGAADDCLYLAKETRDAAYWIEYGLEDGGRPMTFGDDPRQLDELAGDTLGELSSC